MEIRRAVETVAKERKYCKNTVKGSRKGSKWPEEIKTAAICDLLVSNNICAVARRYGVPESTLRTWLTAARKKSADEKKSLFDAAREAELRALNHNAAAAARNSVEFIRRRLEANEADAAIYAGAKARLDEADGIFGGERPGGGKALTVQEPEVPMSAEERESLQAAMARHKPMGDFAAANYLRALTGVAGKSAQLLGEEKTEDKTIRIEMHGMGEEMAR